MLRVVKMGKRLVRTLKMSILMMLCLIMTLSLLGCAKEEAKKDFETLSKEISQLQFGVSNKIHEGESLVTDTKTGDLTDPSLLEALKKQIDLAKADTDSIPTIGSETDEIKQQIEELMGRKEELQSQLDSLDNSILAISDSKEKMVKQIAAEKEVKINEAISPNNTYSIIVTDGKGNKEKITIKIGNWIKGSETDLLGKAWSKVGGSGSMPLTGPFSGGTFQSKEAAYVFGTVLIENMTPEFTAKNFSDGDISVTLSPDVPVDEYFAKRRCLTDFGLTVAQGREYVSEINGSEINCNLVGGQKPLVQADMVSNSWGPVPFVIGVENVFTPKFPEGDPKFYEASFYLTGAFATLIEGDFQFQIGKTW